MSGRLLAVGDIHGCDRACSTLFRELALTSQDTLIVLGDVVDRGPGTPQVIDQLLELQSSCQLRLIQGNHEELMLGVIDGEYEVDRWLPHGGKEVMAQYGGLLSAIPHVHQDFLRSALPYWETGTEVFVHANLEPGVPLELQEREWLRWTRLSGHELPLETGQRVLCGHTPQGSGLPWKLRGWLCIDTACCRGGWLTAVDVQTDEVFQANQQGELRAGVL